MSIVLMVRFGDFEAILTGDATTATGRASRAQYPADLVSLQQEIHMEEHITARIFSKRYRFADWPNPRVPMIAAGVYAIWQGDRLIYCGMSGRSIEKQGTKARKKYGLVTRLNSHASGRLSGDQFCVYVANRIIIPNLQVSLLPKFESGDLTLDKLTKDYIRQNFEYQFSVVSTSEEAYELERLGRSGKTFGLKPFLNPGR